MVLLIFIVLYAKIRHNKYRRALYEELQDTDQNGNPIKTARLDKIYKHSKPIKPPQAPPPPPPKLEPIQTIVRQVPVPVKPNIVAVRQTPIPRVAIISRMMNTLTSSRPLTMQTPAPTMPLPIRTQPQMRLVKVNKPVTPSYVQLNVNRPPVMVDPRYQSTPGMFSGRNVLTSNR